MKTRNISDKYSVIGIGYLYVLVREETNEM